MNNQKTETHKKFRRDINGLRAIAVLIVILFHMGMSDVSGGFVGVDVFFVISGYLIVPRVRDACRFGTFSMLDFMSKRIRRLMPALIPVLVYVLVVGTLFLGNGAFDELIGSIAAAAGFVSNYLFIFTRGYFERSIDTMLLLHSWSLGVEFQFYLLIPFVFVLFKRWAISAFMVLMFASFVASVLLTESGSNYAYYDITSRFWQLALGGGIGMAQPLLDQKLKFRGSSMLRVVGLGLIFYAAVTFTGQMPFPGLLAVAPTIGAGLIIATPPSSRDFLSRVLSSKSLGWIGLRSYSIYLWHWPLLKTVNLTFEDPDDGTRAAAILVTLILADISYRFVELPVQRGLNWKSLRRTRMLTILPLTVFGGLMVLERAGATLSNLRVHLPFEEVRILSGVADPFRDAYFDKIEHVGMLGEGGLCSLDVLQTVAQAKVCLIGASTDAQTLFIGDSHGRDLFLTFQEAFPSHKFHLLHQSGCAPASYGECFPDLSDQLPSILQSGRYHNVVLVSHWPQGSLSASEKTMLELAQLDVRVLVLGAGPVFNGDAANAISLKDATTLSDASRTIPANFRFDVNAANIALRDIAEKFDSIFVDRLSLLCESDECLAFVPSSNDLIYFDNQHLSLPAMTYLGRLLRQDTALVALFD